jgi:hypothetical protein
VNSLLETRRIFVAVLVIGLVALAARGVSDPDVWWHLRTGQLIVESHQIPHLDAYSFTRAGQPWIDHEWLSQVAMYAMYRLAGWGGLIVAFAAIVAISLWTVYLRCPGRPYTAGTFAIWGATASAPSWGVRPQMFSLLLANVFLLILERSDKHPRLLLWTVPLTVLWVNLHAGYLVGIGLMILFLAGYVLEVASSQNWRQAAPHVRRLGLTLGACLAVIPLNPNRIQMYRYPLETLRSRSMQTYVDEWLSPNFHQAKELPFLFMLLAVLLALGLSARRLRARELLWLLATTWLALHSARHIPIFVLIAVPILAASAQTWLEERGAGSLLGSTVGSPRSPRRLVNAMILGAFVVFTIVRVRVVIRDQPKTEAQHFPAAAVSFLARERPPGPILNNYNWGGYFIAKLYPGYRVFIDGRADLYGDSFMDDFYATYHLTDGWERPINQWQIQTILLPPDAPLVTALRSRPGWKQIYTDPQSVVLTQIQ